MNPRFLLLDLACIVIGVCCIIVAITASTNEPPALQLEPLPVTAPNLDGHRAFCTTGGTMIVVAHPETPGRFATARVYDPQQLDPLQAVDVTDEWGWFAVHLEIGCYRIGQVNARAEVYRLRLGYP